MLTIGTHVSNTGIKKIAIHPTNCDCHENDCGCYPEGFTEPKENGILVNAETLSTIVQQAVQSGVEQGISEAVRRLNLDNRITDADGHIEGSTDDMARIKQKISFNGKTARITGDSLKDFTERVIAYVQQDIDVVSEPVKLDQCSQSNATPVFGEYLKNFVETYKCKQQLTTVQNRWRVIKRHVLPELGNIPIGEIKVDTCQRWFDRLCDEGYSRETLLKIKNSISPAFDYAVEEEIIPKNPFKSKLFRINTDKGEHRKAIPAEKIQEVKAGLDELPDRERRMMALFCYTGMRPEEVLGLRWEDISDDAIHIRRAVVHPSRSKPLIKCPKTKSSARTIPATERLLKLLQPMGEEGFVVSGEESLTYRQYTKAYERVKERFHLDGYCPNDFRSSCGTLWFENNMSMEAVSKLMGHANSSVTERCYVKLRKASMDKAKAALEAVL